MKQRGVQRIIRGRKAVDGAGVRLVRVIGHDDVKELDPFLLLDAFDSTDPEDYVKGFPWHPHRGIETVTFLAEGRIEHGDSLGNKGEILGGSCQWMRAGSGIIHQEMPKAAPRMLGLQLWINLPASLKMSAPEYRDIRADAIPVSRGDGFEARVIAGEFGGARGARAGSHVDATMLDVSVEAGASMAIPAAIGHTAFAYMLSGSAAFGPVDAETTVERHAAALFSDGDVVSVRALPDAAARFVFFCGKPIKESVAWGGPIVMNTDEELDAAFRELDEGSFIKAGLPLAGG
jgi:redox-sensitive bicupin YhaK (pirin superfamily)